MIIIITCVSTNVYAMETNMYFKILPCLLSLLLFAACGINEKMVSVVTLADVGGSPDGVGIADSGNVYVTDIDSGEIKQIDNEGEVKTVADLTDTVASHPDGIVAVTEEPGDVLYVADTGSTGDATATDGSIKKIEVSSDGTSTITDFVDSTHLDSPACIARDDDGNLYVADQGTGDVYKIPVTGGTAGTPESLTDTLTPGVTLANPHGLTLTTNEDGSITLYTTDQAADSNNVVEIDIPASGNIADVSVTELTPDSTGGTDEGTLDEAKFDSPHGIGTNDKGAIFVCDENNNRVQIITPSGNVISFAGDGTAGDTDGDAETAQLNKPRGLAVDKNGDLLICDYGNGKVKKVEQ